MNTLSIFHAYFKNEFVGLILFLLFCLMILGRKVKWDLVFCPTCFSNTFRVTPPYPPQIRFTSFKCPYHLLIANLYNDNYVDLGPV